MHDHHFLPPEIWLEIFHWATAPTKFDSSVAHKPFQPRSTLDAHDPSWHVRARLALVCRQWRRMVSEFLYRDIVIDRGVDALKQVIVEGDDTIRNLVQCVILPYGSTVPGPNVDTGAIQILNLCKDVRTLVRPRSLADGGLLFQYEAEAVDFPSLQRLDWWHLGEAERSGGINSLVAVLSGAPKLEYLFIGGVTGATRVSMMCDRLHLPRLHTLRLHAINGLLLRQILTRWEMPALHRVVMDSPLIEQAILEFWETFGQQLRSVEFGKHLRFLMSDNLSICLRGCPNLEDIHYFMFFTTPPSKTDVFPSVMTVGVHAAVNSFLVDEPAVVNMIEQHFNAFTGSMFPNLRCLKLYGQWAGILEHRCFIPIRQKLVERKCELEIVGSSYQ